MNLGLGIKKLRIAADLSATDLASMVRITPQYLSLIENGHRKPSFKMVELVAEHLQIPVELLIWESFELPESATKRDRKLIEKAKAVLLAHYDRP